VCVCVDTPPLCLPARRHRLMRALLAPHTLAPTASDTHALCLKQDTEAHCLKTPTHRRPLAEELESRTLAYELDACTRVADTVWHTSSSRHRRGEARGLRVPQCLSNSYATVADTHASHMPLALSLPAVGAIAAEREIQLYLARRIALSSVLERACVWRVRVQLSAACACSRTLGSCRMRQHIHATPSFILHPFHRHPQCKQSRTKPQEKQGTTLQRERVRGCGGQS